MKNLRECIMEAAAEKRAVGHFNVSNLEGVWAIFHAAQKLNTPVIIGVSEGERDFVGVRQIAAVVQTIRDEFQFPIFLNADHTYSFEKVREAIDAGFDAVIYDGAKQPIDHNIATAKQCVEYAHLKGKHMGKEILVEGELGFIGQSSQVHDSLPTGVTLAKDTLTTPEDAVRFVKETGVDLLAPAVGNFHGIVRNMESLPEIDTELVAAIRQAAGVPLVLHGGSGSSEKEFKGAIASGAAIVHINTELRLAYRQGLVRALQEMPDEIAPYKYLKGALAEMQAVVEKKLALFNNLN